MCNETGAGRNRSGWDGQDRMGPDGTGWDRTRPDGNRSGRDGQDLAVLLHHSVIFGFNRAIKRAENRLERTTITGTDVIIGGDGN